MMEIKMRIRIGAAEIDYEGEANFLKSELPAIVDLFSKANIQSQPIEVKPDERRIITDHDHSIQTSKTNYSVSTIANKCGASSGSQLALAAAACLTFTDGRDAFSRQELLKKMQEAKSYYKKSYGSNLSKTLASLVKSNALLEGTSNTYSLSAEKNHEMRGKLGI